MKVYQNPLIERYSSERMAFVFHHLTSLSHGESVGLHLRKGNVIWDWIFQISKSKK